MSAPVIGKIPYKVIYYPSLDQIATVDNISSLPSAAVKEYTLTPAIETINIISTLSGPMTCLIKLLGNNLPEIFGEQERGFVLVQFGAESNQSPAGLSKLFAVKRIQSDLNVETGSTSYTLDCGSVSSVYSPVFSRYFEGSLQDVIKSMTEVVYSKKGLSQYIPEFNMSENRVFGANLVQFQTLDNYIDETRIYAASDMDYTPFLVWEDFHAVNGRSLQELLNVPGIQMIVTSYDRIGEAMSFPITEGDSDRVVGYYAEDFRNEVKQDTQKLRRLERTTYIVPTVEGSIHTYYTTPNSGARTNDIPETVEIVNQNYDIKGELASGGKAKIIRAHCNKLMTTGLASFRYYQNDLYIRPGDVLDMITGNEHVGVRKYIAIQVAATSSNKSGYQEVTMIDAEAIIKFVKENQGQSPFTTGMSEHVQN